MTLVKLTHANLLTPVYVVKSLIGFWHYSEKNKATHVYVGPNVFPAKESPEEVEKILGLTPAPKEGAANG